MGFDHIKDSLDKYKIETVKLANHRARLQEGLRQILIGLNLPEDKTSQIIEDVRQAKFVRLEKWIHVLNTSNTALEYLAPMNCMEIERGELIRRQNNEKIKR